MDDEKNYTEPEADESEATEETAQDETSTGSDEAHSDYKPVNRFDASAVHHLSGMYQNWFLDYASYVILERAVPHISDGLKPVQRRIMHSMKRMDDGRYNKVANIVGHTMQFHPHGDASIGDALVQMGQKDLLVDCQGNWGNILTGDRAAAPRYIEARLSKFALEVLFNEKNTQWQYSYDGRNKEPITLPAKFPLLLAQGAEGIAVGLSSKILPHNFCELCDAAVHYLKDEPFALYPDFPTGGSIDVSKYNDGQRGGTLRVRAKIEKVDQKTLAIREIPFGKTTGTLIDSILRAIDKGKIKVRRVDDNTAAQAEILLHLAPGVSSDKTIDALYAFSDCEVSISPNCCVIEDDKPQFLAVSDVLRHSVDTTKALLKRELEIRRGELLERLFFASLEKIFIEERIYKDKEFEQAKNLDIAVAWVDSRLEPFKPQLVREVTRDDILRLLEIKMQRILKFNKDKADELMAALKKELKEVERDLRHIVEVTIHWFDHIREKYGAAHPRRTEIRNFDTIEAAKVAEANQKLYINQADGFIGTGLKKDKFLFNCSDIDEVLVFFRDGKYKMVRVADKIFVGKNVLHVQLFKKGDTRTTYNIVYRDGKQGGAHYIKRCNIPALIRDKEYNLTLGTPGSRIEYFTANPNGEAETIKVILEPMPRLRNVVIEKDFSEIGIHGRSSRGYLLTRNIVSRINLKSHGHSTLGGRKVWFDGDVNRLNYDEHGRFLGEFGEGDSILVVLSSGEYYLSNADPANHYEDNILRIEKYDEHKIWTAIVIDADNKGLFYIKRFELEATKNRRNIAGENPKSQLVALTDDVYPRLLVSFGGRDEGRPDTEIDVETFCVVRSWKAHGRRVSSFEVAKAEFGEPTRYPEEAPLDDDSADSSVNSSDSSDSSDSVEPSESPSSAAETDSTDAPSPRDDTPSPTLTFKLSPTGEFDLFDDGNQE